MGAGTMYMIQGTRGKNRAARAGPPRLRELLGQEKQHSNERREKGQRQAVDTRAELDAMETSEITLLRVRGEECSSKGRNLEKSGPRLLLGNLRQREEGSSGAEAWGWNPKRRYRGRAH